VGQRALEAMADPRSIFALCEYFRSRFRHEDGVFELGGESSVAGSYGPVVFRVEFGETSTGVDHRFDGKAHARQESVLLAFSIGEVGDVWVLMEPAAESVSDVFANDRKTPLGRFGDDIVTDNADGASRF